MRSHVTNLSSETEEKGKKVLSQNNGGDCNTGYGLRENPKKTWRFADSSEEDTSIMVITDKFCKECGKGFQSWKALFGHMKSHFEKQRVVSNSTSLEDQDSWTNSNNAIDNATTTQKLIMDSQSDNEITAPKRKRRSERRTRYTGSASAAATSSVSFANPGSSSISDVEHEQEEVAMSLMMLSKDLSPWSGLHSRAESSDNNSANFEAPRSSVRTNLVTRIEGNKKWEFANSIPANFKSKGKSSEPLSTESPENEFKMKRSGVSLKEFIKNGKSNSKSELDFEGEQGKNRVNGTESVLSKYSSIKTKFLDAELESNSLKNRVKRPLEGEFSKNSHKRGKFECTTCNKIFHSYQALGGHRASHKKNNKGCFASKNESSENSIETEPKTEIKLKKSSGNEHVVEHELGAGLSNEVERVKESKKNKGHECPICLKVFQSGQALGGHKRSHLSGKSEIRNFQPLAVVQKPVPEIRDFLDLNLPASTEEESTSYADSSRPWWVVD